MGSGVDLQPPHPVRLEGVGLAKAKRIGEFIVIERSMFSSKAWRSLTSTSKIVLADFLCKRQMEEIKHPKRGSEWAIKNNGKITYTYAEAEKRGIPRSSFQRAIDELIAKGFISIAQSGAGVVKAATLYWIDDRWKDYGTSRFTHRRRPRKRRWTRGVGFQKGHPKFGTTIR